MKTRSFLVLAAAATILSAARPSAAARPADDPLALVPPDAVSAGMIRLSDLRSSPLAARLFSDFDRTTVDGDAARFLAEARLHPIDDVDTIVFAANAGPNGRALVVCEGRFEPDRLGAAVASRGAKLRTTDAGSYYLLPHDGTEGHDGDGAVAFVTNRLVVAGSEPAVVAALAARAAGGTGFLSGAGLGRNLGRVDLNATGWLLVDRTKLPEMRRMNVEASEGDAAGAVVAAMKTVSLFAFQMTTKGDALKLSASGFAADAETAELLEDAVRGVLAAMRLSAQDKPEVVSVLRKFKVTRDGEVVTVAGTLPGEVVRALAEKRHERKTVAERD